MELNKHEYDTIEIYKPNDKQCKPKINGYLFLILGILVTILLGIFLGYAVIVSNSVLVIMAFILHVIYVTLLITLDIPITKSQRYKEYIASQVVTKKNR